MTEQLTSVRFKRETIETLKTLAELNDGSVASEIRKAVDAYIVDCTSQPDFSEQVDRRRRELEQETSDTTARLLQLAALGRP